MKIIHVMRTMEFGGIERLVLDLCQEQFKKGLEVGVLVGSRHGQMGDIFDSSGITIIDAELKSGFDPGWLKSNHYKGVLKTADIIHVHVYNPTMAKWIQCSKKPIVYTVHGLFGFGRKHTWRDKIKFRMRSRFLKKHVDYITFNSYFTQRVSEEHFDIAAIQRSVVYNGINFDRYDQLVAKKPEDSTPKKKRLFLIGTTSRFAGFKRVDRLIKAFAGMKYRQNCHLILVGDGPLRQSYVSLAESLGVADQVEFTGYKADVHNYQSKMDVCVFPSCGEPFGLVAVETLALGIPTIVMCDGGGIVEIVEPIELENVVEGIEGLTQRLDECFVFWNKRNDDEVNRTNRMTHARRFSIDRMTCEFDKIYSSLLHTSKVRSCRKGEC